MLEKKLEGNGELSKGWKTGVEPKLKGRVNVVDWSKLDNQNGERLRPLSRARKG